MVPFGEVLEMDGLNEASGIGVEGDSGVAD